MKVLISQATIVDKRHPDHNKVKDILVEDGIITSIEDHLDVDADLTVSHDNLLVSIGWMDMRANFRDPGLEHQENLESGIKAASAGGFTAVALSPYTTPAVDNKGAVEYLINRSAGSAVQVVPIGAASKGLKGESLAEMYDMYLAGARAFGDDKTSMHESGLLHRALLYSKNFDAPIFHFPYDASLMPGGQMHEGDESTALGLKGIPAIAEDLVVARDLSLLQYTEGRLHLGPLSAASAVTQVAAAREKGLRVTCETTAAHLAYSDELLQSFDSQYKLMPPLRDQANRLALIDALVKGHIQVLSSDHSPEDEEHKKLEFDYANFGTAGIESFWPLVWNAVGDRISLQDLVATFSIHPREILGLEVPEITVGSVANLSLFSTAGNTDFNEVKRFSKAYNFAEKASTLPGKVLGTLYRGHCTIKD